MRRRSPKANARLVFRQGIGHSLYLTHLYNLFREFIQQGFSLEVIGDWGLKNNLPRISISFATLALPTKFKINPTIQTKDKKQRPIHYLY
jgi:hypothetical protein